MSQHSSHPQPKGRAKPMREEKAAEQTTMTDGGEKEEHPAPPITWSHPQIRIGTHGYERSHWPDP
jgi:hypothetical protein